jgi:endonuclease/exonuclease/phosphatase family metal-dependent hydrolase
MKLIQLNIWQGRLIKQVLKFLDREQPDIICLQEVYSSTINTLTHDFLGSQQKIQANFPSYHSYYSAVCDMPVLGKKVRYGNALFSRFEISDEETHFVHQRYHSYSDSESYAAGEGLTEGANLQQTTVRLGGGKSFTVFNHHAYWVPNHMGNETSAAALEKVASIIRQSPRPLILSGDLNVVAESPAMNPILEILTDLTKENNLSTTLSQFGAMRNVACDHICISEGIEVRDFSVREDLVSDHQALVLEFELV